MIVDDIYVIPTLSCTLLNHLEEQNLELEGNCLEEILELLEEMLLEIKENTKRRLNKHQMLIGNNWA